MLIESLRRTFPKILLFADLLVVFFLILSIIMPVRGIYQKVDQPSKKWVNINERAMDDIQKQIILSKVSKRIEQEAGDYMVYIKDLTNSKTWKVGKEKRYPPASTFKVFTATLTLLSIEKGDIGWNSKVRLSKGLVSPGPGTYFTEKDYGSYYTVRDLLYRMIVTSDNTAQSMLFALLGKSNIEARLKTDLNLENTSLLDFYTTNEDIASVLERHYNAEILNEENSKYLKDLMYQTIARDRIRAGIPSNVRVENKGGTLDTSKHDVAIVYGPETKYIIVVYTEGVNNDKAIITIKDVSKIVWDILK